MKLPSESTVCLLLQTWHEDPERSARALVSAAARIGSFVTLPEWERLDAIRTAVAQAIAGELEVPAALVEQTARLAQMQASLRRALERLRDKGVLPAEALQSRHALARLADAHVVALSDAPGPIAAQGVRAFAAMARNIRGGDLLHCVVVEGEIARLRGVGGCAWCEEPVTLSELRALRAADAKEGVPCGDGPLWHLECRARSVLGGLNHLQGRCHCCGGTEPPDPPEMTRRQAARAAFAFAAGGATAERALH